MRIVLSSGEIATLLAVSASQADVTLNALSKSLPYDYNTTAQFVLSLEARGLLVAKREGRYKFLRLTPSGVEEASQLGRRWILVDTASMPCGGCVCRNHLLTDKS